jgi:hypothetical protein
MCETTYYLLWNLSATFTWEDALSLPIFPFIKPYIVRFGFSERLLESMDVWSEICTNTLVDQFFCARPEIFYGRDSARDEYSSYGDTARIAILDSFNQFSIAVDRETAVELDQWVRRNFFCRELELSIDTWKRLFQLAARPDSGSTDYRVRTPPALDRVLPLIQQKFHEEYTSLRFAISISQSAEKYFTDHSISVSSDHIECMGTNVCDVIDKSDVIEIFQKISTDCSHRERQDIVSWAMMQLSVLRNVRWTTTNLYGDRFFTTELPCSNTPSILDLPDLD